MVRHRFVVAIAVVLVSLPIMAQTPDDKIQQLERRLDDLVRQADQIRQELNALKGAAPAAAAAPEEDLTKIEVAQTPATPPAATTEPPALTDVQPVINQTNPGASKALNPDLSVIGVFIGHAGQRNPFEEVSPVAGGLAPGESRSPVGLDEVEVAYEAFIDPYAKGRFFISLGPDGVDLEEGYANFVALPNGFTAKAGKLKATFGKDNTWHTHVRPWIDQPLMIQRFFGPEGISDYGVSVSKTIDIPGVFAEVTGEVFSGNAGNAFARQSDNDLLYNGHFKVFRDITEDSNVELGTSYARGALPESGGSNSMAGVDVTYRWKPLSRSIYNSFIVRFEGLANRRADTDRNLYGFYTSADYQLGQRWYTGVRIDRADRAFPFSNGQLALSAPGRFTDRSVSATLTFWPSEFSQIRGQLRRSDYAGLKAANELLLQLQFSIGAHGAHAF